MAIMFARNQGFIPCLAIPEKLIAYYDESDIEVCAYSEINSVLQITSQFKPDIVMFFSAYLFTVNGLATEKSFSDLMLELDSRNIKLVTSDPFARVFDLFPDMSFSNGIVEARDEENKIRSVTTINENVTHLYNYKFESDSVNYYSFYNKKFRQNHINKDKIEFNWCFVLSNVDLRLLMREYGDGFYAILEKKINEICKNNNNHVTLVVPDHFISKFEARSSYIGSQLEMLGFCSLMKFESIIANSDVVFYWNILSNSVLMCWYYDVPTLFFDKGHMGHLNETLYEHMLKHAYEGGEPEYITVNDDLSAGLEWVLEKHYSINNRKNILAKQRMLSSPESIVQDMFR